MLIFLLDNIGRIDGNFYVASVVFRLELAFRLVESFFFTRNA